MKPPHPREVERRVRDMARINFDRLERRMVQLVELARRHGTASPDGWPASTLGGGPHSTDSRTETAALALADPEHRLRDVVHEQTERAWVHLQEASSHLQAAQNALDAVDQHLDPKDLNAAPTCESCTGKRGRKKGDDNPVAHTGTVGDRLPHAAALCSDCWRFVEQSAKAGTHAGYLPTEGQIRDHEQRGRWKVRVA